MALKSSLAQKYLLNYDLAFKAEHIENDFHLKRKVKPTLNYIVSISISIASENIIIYAIWTNVNIFWGKRLNMIT